MRGRYLLLPLLSWLGASACRQPIAADPRCQVKLLAEAAGAREGEVIDLARIADRHWEHVHVFGPYASPEQVERALGFAWKDPSVARLAAHEQRALLVWAERDHVACHAEVDRRVLDFCNQVPAGGLTPEQARMQVHVDGQGRRLLCPVAPSRLDR